MHRNCTLLCYDASGEVFQKAAEIKEYAGFVKRAQSAMFSISISYLETNYSEYKRLSQEMYRLLSNYVIGMQNYLGTSTKNQHLVIVYTKADEIDFVGKWQSLGNDLRQGWLESLISMNEYIKGMHRVSTKLRDFTLNELQAHDFVTLVDDDFKSVTFSMVSALGAKANRQMSVKISPRLLLDPLLWVMENSL